VGVDESHVVHVQGPRHSGPEGGDRQGDVLVQGRVDAEARGRVLVLPDGNEVVARLGLHDQPDAQDAQDRQEEGDVVIGDLGNERGHDHDSHHPAGERLRDCGDVPYAFPQGERRQGEIRTPEGETDGAERQADQEREEPPENHPPPGRELQVLEKETGGVGPHPEEGGMPEGDLPGEPRKEVPGGTDDDPDEEKDHQVEKVVALQDKREQNEHRQQEQREKVLLHRALPVFILLSAA
jgi:hypothetical protein